MTKIAADSRLERPEPRKPARKPSAWESAPDFSSLVATLFPKLVARAAPTVPLPGNQARAVAPGSIAEAVLALATAVPVEAALEAPAPALAEGTVDLPADSADEVSALDYAPPDEEGKLAVDELAPVDEPMTDPVPRAASTGPAPLPALSTSMPDAPNLPAVELMGGRPAPSVPPPLPQVAPPPVFAPASLDFDDDFLPVREAHIGRASASITVGEGAERVSLRITADSQDVKVHAVVASAEAALQLQRGAGELAAQLAQHGLNLSGLSADTDGSGGGAEPAEPGEHEAVEALDEAEQPLTAAGIRAVI